MSERSLYETVLARLGAGAGLPRSRPPRASASVVPWRRSARGLEVYWVRRAHELAFMGGWHAFPGGSLSRRDAGVEVAGEPSGLGDGPADAGMPEAVTGELELEEPAPPGLVACAARELFEETGLLVSAESLDGGSSPAALRERIAALRADLEARRIDFAEALRALGVRLDGSLLTYAGRWLTPPLGPVRFDNRFFLLPWPEARRPQPWVTPGELVEGEWVVPREALARWRAGEVITAPPIVHLLRVLAEDGPEAGLGRLRAPVETNLGAHRAIEFRPGVLVFPLPAPTLPPATHTNAYVLGHGETVLVDPGSPFPREIDRLHGALEALAERGRRLTAIWLTHHHLDHVGGAAALRERLGVPVLAHPATAERLAGRVPVDGPLADGQRVELAGEPAMTIRVVHTPGHARGHLAFFDETLGSLLAGDLVSGLGTIVIDPPEGEMGAYLDSLARVRDLGVRTLFPAHGPVLLDARRKLQETVDHRLMREERVRAAWGRGLREPGEILADAYDDLEPVAVPLAERQVVAHLARLRQLGSIASRS